MARFKYIGAPHPLEATNIPEGDPDWFDGREWDGFTDERRYRLVFSTAAGPDYAGYAVCLGDIPEATGVPTPAPMREVFTVYLVSGQQVVWPQNKPEKLVARVYGDGVLEVSGPRDIPPSIFAPGMWTHCGVRLVEQPS